MTYDIETLKRKMLVKYPFFGSVVVNVNYKEMNEINTAATDGKEIYYNPVFLESLNVEEQIFVLAHEVCHIAFNHVLKSEGKDTEIWNIATDAVINQYLKRDGLSMIEGFVDIPEAINYDSEQLYEKLLKEKHQTQKNQSQQQSSHKQKDSGSPDQHQEQNAKDCQHQNHSEKDHDERKTAKKDVDHDTHQMWSEAVRKHKEEEERAKEKDKSLLDRLFPKTNNKRKQKEDKMKEKQQEIKGEREAFQKNREEKKNNLEKLKQSIVRQASQAGTKTASDVRRMKDIGTAGPLIDWRYVLREAITYDVDWSYQNALIEDGVVKANLEEMPKPETEIVLDTSGSINEILLKNFLRECKNILYHSRVKVGCFDTKFYGFEEIRTEEDIEKMKFVGGGGTNFDVATQAFSGRVENKIIFTDGEAPMPKNSLDAIWIVFGEEKIEPKGGKVIYITKEQLDRLYDEDYFYELKGRSK